MRLQIVGVGRLKDGPERSLTDDYLARALPLARQLGVNGTPRGVVGARGGGLWGPATAGGEDAAIEQC